MPTKKRGAPDGKNIVICCDGTGNQFGETNTNVVKLFSVLDVENTAKQVAFYDPGVGTGNPREALTRTRRVLDKAAGLAFGAGLYRNLSDAYKFLMRNFQEGDRIFVFGFSRGAYTARALTGFLHFAGLLRPGSENLVPYALDLYRRNLPSDAYKRNAHFDLGRRFKRTFSRSVRTHFIGVWDTVKTVGLWDALKIKAHLGTALPYTLSMPGTYFGRHAIAIDERRSRFRPNSWNASKSLQQAWFKGVHCDVGGGYKEAGLSDIALNWVMIGAEKQGLLLNKDAYADLAPSHKAPPHESLTWAWRPLGWSEREIREVGTWNKQKKDWNPARPFVHESAADHPRVPDEAIVVGDDWDEVAAAYESHDPRGDDQGEES